jgi:hypothetical protein
VVKQGWDTIVLKTGLGLVWSKFDLPTDITLISVRFANRTEMTKPITTLGICRKKKSKLVQPILNTDNSHGE